MSVPIEPIEAIAPPAPHSAPRDTPLLVRFWQRLKSHKAIQWTLAYAAGAFALLQAADIVAGAFDWSRLTVRVLTLLFAMGLPAVAVLAWYHGHKRQQRIGRTELSILGMLLLLTAALLWLIIRAPAARVPETAGVNSGSAPTTALTASKLNPALVPRASIAVMPFSNLTGNASQEYFSDGMAEELIDSLAQVEGLKVSARTSTFAYKGHNVDIRRIARDLGVRTILEGSVRGAGNRIRVTAQLIDAQTGFHMWSQSYNREFADIFNVQGELARAIVQALRGAMGAGAAPPVLQGPPTRDVEAYQMYLQAKAMAATDSEENFRKALALLNEALLRDPGFAAALAERAGLRASFLSWGFPMPNALEDAERDAHEALGLSPNLASALEALGHIEITRGNWLEADRIYRTALEGHPGEPEIHANYAFGVLTYVGKLSRARAELREAYRLAPANPYISTLLAFVSATSGRDAEAIKFAELSLALGGSDYPLRYARALAGAHAGNLEILRDFKLKKLAPALATAGADRVLRLNYAAISDRSRKPAARQAIRALLSRVDFRDVGSTTEWQLAEHLTVFGELDLAYEHANAAVDKSFRAGIVGGNSWDWIWDPLMRPFRNDARFQALASRLSFTEYWKEHGAPDDCELKGGVLVCG